MRTTLKATGCVLLVAGGIITGYVIDHQEAPQQQPAPPQAQSKPIVPLEPYRHLKPIDWPQDGWRSAPVPETSPEPELLLTPPAQPVPAGDSQVQDRDCRRIR